MVLTPNSLKPLPEKLHFAWNILHNSETFLLKLQQVYHEIFPKTISPLCDSTVDLLTKGFAYNL
jgi:hypothetical protein